MDPTEGRQKLWERCGRRPQHPTHHTVTATPHPRGTPIPTSPGDALESLPSPQSAPPFTLSSTPVSLRYHFAVYRACSSDSSADPSDKLVSGYLYCPQLMEETQTRLKIRGVRLLEKWPELEPASHGCGSRTPGGGDPTPARYAPFLPGSNPRARFPAAQVKSILHPALTQVQAPPGGSCLG